MLRLKMLKYEFYAVKTFFIFAYIQQNRHDLHLQIQTDPLAGPKKKPGTAKTLCRGGGENGPGTP